MDFACCRDIPMFVDIRHAPLNFDVYINQILDVPKTSAESEAYDFSKETKALSLVDGIILRTAKEHRELSETVQADSTQNEDTAIDHCDKNTQLDNESQSEPARAKTKVAGTASSIVIPLLIPSCPTDTPLTPIKSSDLGSPSNATSNKSETQTQASSNSTTNRVNPKEFEDLHFNPFDHLELQTIDERKELDLVFRASYANKDANDSHQ